MKSSMKKFYIRLAVLAAVLYGLSAHIANAGKGFLTILTVIAVIAVAVFAPYLIPVTTEIVVAGLGSVGFLTTVTTIGVTTILSVGGILAGVVACLEGVICQGGQGGVVLAPVAGQSICAFQVPMTFYNPQMGQTRENFYGPYTYPEYYDEDSGYHPSYTINICQIRAVDETQRQVAIYRFTLPAGSSQAALNDWFINQIKTRVGNGYVDYANGNYWWISSAVPEPLVTIPYSQLCSGNVCKFTDATAPANVYVAYVAKILGDYIIVSLPGPPGGNDGGDGGFLWPADKAFAQTCGNNQPNKFFNKDNASNAIFPGDSLGNAIIGPFKTDANCPPPSSATTTPPTPPPVTTPDFYPLSSNNIYATMPKGASGDSTKTTITVVPLNSFSSNISLSVVSSDPALPLGTTYLFSRPDFSSSLYSSGSTFKVHLGSGLQTSQTYSIVIKATGGGLTRTTTILLNANIKNPSFREF